MDARRESEATPMKNRTTVERKSDRELVVTRTFNGPARLVFEAWSKPELFQNAASGGIRERGERVIEAGLFILNHAVQYTAHGAALQGGPSAGCAFDRGRP